ncbi:MAG: hypothetical protein IPM58_00920 [Nitrospira sp.]|nr:hypothetical protein [Nitrospira sp.]
MDTKMVVVTGPVGIRFLELSRAFLTSATAGRRVWLLSTLQIRRIPLRLFFGQFSQKLLLQHPACR